MKNEERPFRCPHCNLFFGWTDGRQLRTQAFIFTGWIKMRCVGCGEFYEWRPTPASAG